MTIYDIDQAILSLVDPETGEILDYEAFEELQMEKEQKIENVALWIKNLSAEAKAIREEEKNLAERRKTAENKAESLKKYLDTILNGQALKTAKFAVSYRRTESVEIDDINKVPIAFLRYSDPEADKTAIKQALKKGLMVEGAHIEENLSMSIK